MADTTGTNAVVVNGEQPETKRQKLHNLREGVLLGYGNPLLDIQVVGTEAFLNKYGLKADNAILAEEKHKPMYQEMVDSFDDVQYVPGGATLNTIKVSQWLLQKPNATTFFGCASKDKFGSMLEDKARALGVNVQFQYTDKEPTGTCAVVVTGDNRSLCANLAAANCFTEAHLDVPSNWNLVEKADFFYCAGFPLTVSPSTILRIAKHAHERHKTFCMNLSAPFLCQFFKEPMLKVLPYVDILFGNESMRDIHKKALGSLYNYHHSSILDHLLSLQEAAAFSEANQLETLEVKEIALKIAAWQKENKERSRMVVITQGDQPAVVAKDGKVTEYPVIPIKAQDIVDTNGAGDAFVGGFISQLILEKSIDDCIRCGHYAANLVIQRSGCTTPEKPDFS